MKEDRGDKLTYEQLEQALATLHIQYNSLLRIKEYYRLKYKTARKELRLINAALKRKAYPGDTPPEETSH